MIYAEKIKFYKKNDKSKKKNCCKMARKNILNLFNEKTIILNI